MSALQRKKCNSELVAAVGTGDIAGVQNAVLQGASIDCRDPYDCTPIYRACACGRLDIVQYLIGAGASVNEGAIAPLLRASTLSDARIAEALLAAGADVTVSNDGGFRPLTEAASVGAVATVSALLEAGAPVDAATQSGGTALVYAASIGPDSARRLLFAGACVDAATNHGSTPLDFASSFCNEPAIALLVAAGADVKR